MEETKGILVLLTDVQLKFNKMYKMLGASSALTDN